MVTDRWKGSLDQWKTREGSEEPYPIRCGVCGLVYPADASLEEELHHHDLTCQRRYDLLNQLSAFGHGIL